MEPSATATRPPAAARCSHWLLRPSSAAPFFPPGISLAVKTLRPDVEIIGVESETCPSFTAALEAGEPVTVEVSSTLADGLAVPKVGPLAFKVCWVLGAGVGEGKGSKVATTGGWRCVDSQETTFLLPTPRRWPKIGSTARSS